MRLASESDQLFQGFDQWKMFKWLLGFGALLSSCFTVSVVGFLRKDMGERYYNSINLFFGYTIVANFAFLGNVIGVASGHGFSWLMLLFWLAFIVASIYHRREISRKNKAGEEWHTMCHGTSILPLPFSEETIFKVCEPLLVFLIGLVFWKISLQVGVWLMACGLALLINNHLVFHFQRQKVLDARDGMIEARNIGKAMQGLPARQTSGFVMAGSTIQLVHKDAGLQEAFARMSPELKGMFDSAPNFGRA